MSVSSCLMLVMWSEISSMVVLYGGCSHCCGCICWLNIWSMICNSDAESGSGCKVGGVAFCVVVSCSVPAFNYAQRVDERLA